ncbi:MULTISPECIES: HpcH/HpaI aldolase/citrate lyase family protein [Nitrospirillum]|uniref:Citrate lyase subunit beta/citryl-CoA lyase n=1 Tax=Nitrospirillum amazonense TaxID=28077 RepID=A0A560EWN0_9PROT|nr:CoA ester lyase [Nitrospirillum amazonense]MEC4594514.1 CoA ester lyase [Nitrospirillum amazonense]TWB13771.1 citrate lyase subunit beta/citryl-CoA lyase [Nitrospirillum amazonense]
MATTARPRRSALYMPGSNARALEKAKGLEADVLILDLEDAVAPDAKDLARDQVQAAVAAGGFGRREVLIRVNGLDTPWGHADLAAAARSGAHGVLIPKVESAEAVRQADRLLAAHGAAPGTPNGLPLWVMMETALGMLNAKEIASASPRLAGLVLGTSDLAKELHAHHTPLRLPVITALGLCLLAARAHGLAILDGVHLDLDDDAGLEASCRQGVELGFDGKTLIHPKQLAAANAAFAPDAASLDRARRIIAAHAEAMAQGKAVVLVDGRLVEALHVAEAHRLVALAASIGAAAISG